MNRAKTHVKKGDNVIVISGNHTGATGKILQVLTKKNHVVIEGVRMIKKHQKKSQDRPQGEIVQREGPIHISNVKMVEKAEKAGKSKAAKPKAVKPKKKAA
ncbi:MAG: 50S ribosomal protein L24 [Chthoniobacteraceae bacterium]